MCVTMNQCSIIRAIAAIRKAMKLEQKTRRTVDKGRKKIQIIQAKGIWALLLKVLRGHCECTWL